MSKRNSNRMLSLFKFRSLGDDESMRRAKDILETGRFWCSRLWEQNDPMEGVFRFGQGELHPNKLKELFFAKNRRFICSFSGTRAFERPTMWGYYAGGFKGIAIEIRVAKKDVQKVSYDSNSVDWIPRKTDESLDTWIDRVLTTKLMCWRHEDEYRFLTRESEGEGARNIGDISDVYFGCPYKTVANSEAVNNESETLRAYHLRVATLRDIARQKGIRCSRAYVEAGKVTSSPLD